MTDENNNTVNVTGSGNTYKFTMPSASVTVAVQTTLNLSKDGDGTHGGLVGTVVNATITSCGFVGEITNRSFSCGGLVGWADSNGKTAISNSFVAGSFDLNTSVTGDSSYTFSRNPDRVEITNCYYLTALKNVNEGAVQLTEEAFKSGEAAYLLNGSDDGVWKQTIGTDTYPNFAGLSVYKNTCMGNTFYSDTGGDYTEHNYDNGFCINCGACTDITPTDGIYNISNAGELFAFADVINGGEKNANAILTADIDLENRPWTTICETPLYREDYGDDLGYSGTFDGAGHTIKNLALASSTTTEASCGLFGTVSGTVKNLGIDGAALTFGGQDMRAGIIAGQLIKTGHITDGYVANAQIPTNSKITGGIAGGVYEGTIEKCLLYRLCKSVQHAERQYR